MHYWRQSELFQVIFWTSCLLLKAKSEAGKKCEFGNMLAVSSPRSELLWSFSLSEKVQNVPASGNEGPARRSSWFPVQSSHGSVESSLPVRSLMTLINMPTSSALEMLHTIPTVSVSAASFSRTQILWEISFFPLLLFYLIFLLAEHRVFLNSFSNEWTFLIMVMLFSSIRWHK